MGLHNSLMLQYDWVDIVLSMGKTSVTEKSIKKVPDSKFHVAHMGPTWILTAPGGPHVSPMNLDIRGKRVCVTPMHSRI